MFGYSVALHDFLCLPPTARYAHPITVKEWAMNLPVANPSLESLEPRTLLAGAGAPNPRAYDAGDFYYYEDEKQPFRRATDHVLIGFATDADYDAVERLLKRKPGPLAGFREVD